MLNMEDKALTASFPNPAGIEVPLEASFGTGSDEDSLEESPFSPAAALERRKASLRLKIESRRRKVAILNTEIEQTLIELRKLS